MVRLNKRRRSRSNRRSKRRNRNQRGGNWFNPMTWFGEKKEEDEYNNRSAMGGVDTLESSGSTDTGSNVGDTFGSSEPSQFGGRRRRRRRSRRRRKKSRKSRKKRHRRRRTRRRRRLKHKSRRR